MNGKAWLLRLWRAGVLVVLVLLLRPKPQAAAPADRPELTLEQAQRFFPEAVRISTPDRERKGQYVFNGRNVAIGYLLTTSPETDDIRGYSGPNNLLIALDATGAVAKIEILHSDDTANHVELVRRHEKFLPSFAGWIPTQPAPRVDAVSGATLTSMAMAEGVQRRLSGQSVSLRFPERVKVSDVREIFPDTAKLEADGDRLRVLNREGELLGYVVRTSPASDNVSGYAGPSETIVGLKTDGETVVGIWLRKSYDTADYVTRVNSDRYWTKKVFAGRTTKQLADLDYERDKIEGVSGATQTSWAMAEGMKKKFSEVPAPKAAAEPWRLRPRDWGLAAVLLGSLLMTFTHLRGNVWMRRVWQITLVGYVGLWNGDLLSIGLMAGWTKHGIPWQAMPSVALMLAVALIVPWSARRQIYCHHICPHGVAQQWFGLLLKKKPRVPAKILRALDWLPSVLLITAIAVLLKGWPVDLASLEPFDAWAWRAAGVATITIAAVGLIASLFIPQAYCRFGCPTGALLEFVRSHGRADHFGRRDWIAVVMLIFALVMRG